MQRNATAFCHLRRQVDLPGVHSKFIEAHRGVLAALLDLALPVDAVDITKAGVSQFAARYGFLEKPIASTRPSVPV